MQKRNLFIIELSYKVSLDKIDQYLQDHRAFLYKYFANNTFVVSGRKEPRTGGIIIAHVDNRAILEKIIVEDPFHQHQLADYSIIEFVPTLYAKDIEALISASSRSEK